MKFISTAGHGYLKITLKQLEKAMRTTEFRPSVFSYMRGNNVLLEEDRDATEYLKYMNIKDINSISSTYQNDINRNIYKSTPTTLKELDDVLFIEENKKLLNFGDTFKYYDKIVKFQNYQPNSNFKKIIGIDKDANQKYLYQTDNIERIYLSGSPEYHKLEVSTEIKKKLFLLMESQPEEIWNQFIKPLNPQNSFDNPMSDEDGIKLFEEAKNNHYAESKLNRYLDRFLDEYSTYHSVMAYSSVVGSPIGSLDLSENVMEQFKDSKEDYMFKIKDIIGETDISKVTPEQHYSIKER